MRETQSGQATEPAQNDVVSWFATHASLLGSPMDSAKFKWLCAEQLPALIGHQAMFAVVGRMSAQDYTVFQAWNFGYPPELFVHLRGGRTMSSQPTLIRWLKAEKPLFIDADTNDGASAEVPDAGTGVSATLARHGLSCRAVHGIVDGGGAMGSCFAFFGLRTDDRTRVIEGLRLVVPYLHVALMRLCRERSMQLRCALTGRERQLIHLVIEGQTNPQIAKEWNRSVATVRNLLHGLMAKLDVSSRAQLVAIAIQTGLLDSGLPLPPIICPRWSSNAWHDSHVGTAR